MVMGGQVEWSLSDYCYADGVTDDTLNIQNTLYAISQSPVGGTLYMTAGTYLITSDLEILGDGITIRADGNARIVRGSNSVQYMIKNFNPSYAPTAYGGRGNIFIEGGVWDAQGQTYTTGCSIMAFAHAQHIVVRDVQFRNVPDGHGLELCGVSNALVDNCNFEGFSPVTAGREVSPACNIDLPTSSTAVPGMAAGAYDNTICRRVRFTNNYMGAAQDGSGLGAYGQLIGSERDVVATYQTDIVISGNQTDGALDDAIRGMGWKRALVSGNILRLTHGQAAIRFVIGAATAPTDIVVNGNVVDQFDISAIQVDGTGGVYSRLTVNNNTCDGLQLTTGEKPNIGLWGTDKFVCDANMLHTADTAGILLNTCTDGVVGNNKISNPTTVGIDLHACSGLHVVGNKIKSSGTHGITVNAVTADCTIESNTVQSPSQTTNATYYGMHVSNENNLRNLFVANTIKDASSGNQGLAGMGFDGSTPSNNVVVGNVFSGWGTTYTSVIALNGATILDDISGTTTANTLQT